MILAVIVAMYGVSQIVDIKRVILYFRADEEKENVVAELAARREFMKLSWAEPFGRIAALLFVIRLLDWFGTLQPIIDWLTR